MLCSYDITLMKKHHQDLEKTLLHFHWTLIVLVFFLTHASCTVRTFRNVKTNKLICVYTVALYQQNTTLEDGHFIFLDYFSWSFNTAGAMKALPLVYSVHSTNQHNLSI